MSTTNAVAFLRRLMDDEFFMLACGAMADESAIDVARGAGYHFTAAELAEARRTLMHFDKALAAKDQRPPAGFGRAPAHPSRRAQ